MGGTYGAQVTGERSGQAGLTGNLGHSRVQPLEREGEGGVSASVCTHVYMFVCVCVHACGICTCECVCTHEYMWIYVWLCVCMCTCMRIWCMCLCVRVYIYACVYMCVYMYMFANVCTCVCVNVCLRAHAAGLLGRALASPFACAARRPHIMYLNTFNEMCEPKTTPGIWAPAWRQVPLGGVCHSRLAAWATFNK